jgi:hypothetical protein
MRWASVFFLLGCNCLSVVCRFVVRRSASDLCVESLRFKLLKVIPQWLFLPQRLRRKRKKLQTRRDVKREFGIAVSVVSARVHQ